MKTRHPLTGEVWPVNEYLVAFEPEQLLSWEQRPVPENKDAARRDQYIEAIDANRCTYFTTDQFLGLNADTIMREHGAWQKVAFDQVAVDVKTAQRSCISPAPGLHSERTPDHKSKETIMLLKTKSSSSLASAPAWASS
jgi:hypothetical protein